MITAPAVVVATVLIALGLVATTTRRIVRPRAVAATVAGVALILVTLGHTAVTTMAQHYVADASIPVVFGAAAIAIAGWRPLTAAAAVGALLAGPVRVLFEDPFYDPSCLSPCEPNPLALWPQPLVASTLLVAGYALLSVALMLNAMGGRRAVWTAIIGLVAAALWSGAEPGWVILAALIACLVVATDLAKALGRHGRLIAVIEAMAWEGDAEEALRSIAPDIRVAYRAAGVNTLVDRDAQPLERTNDGIDVVGPDGLIAQLQNLGAANSRAVADLIRGPARLGLENLRLAAEGAVRAKEIAASTHRLVAKADAERRRLERDLHDGAQQGLVNLGLQLRRESGTTGVHAAVVDRVVTDLQAIAADVRDIAHGIHAAALDDEGLHHALRVLANRTPVPLAVIAAPDRPIAPSLAAAAYAAVEEVCMIADGPVEVAIAEVDGGINLSILASGNGGQVAGNAFVSDEETSLMRSVDRFRALGGHLVVQPTPSGAQVTGFLPADAS